MSPPWFQDGLRFACTRCGRCCTGEPGFVWVTSAEVAAIADYRNEPLVEVEGLYVRTVGQQRSLREKNNGDCIFYEAGQGCQIYPVRPRQCRTWPFWESNILQPEDWERTRQVCPGAGQGELISADEIMRRMQVIKI